MTTRQALVGLVAAVAGVVVLVLTDGSVPTVLGVLLLVAGGGVLLATGLLGLRSSDPVRAAAAVRAKDAADSAAMKQASETGRWPRIIGGG